MAEDQGVPVLQWQSGEGKRTWVLIAGTEVLARLRFPKAMSTLAEAESAGGPWTFKRLGRFRQRVTVRSSGSDRELAVLHRKWTGEGMLEFPGGRRFHWKRGSFWQSRWSWSADDGTPLVAFRSRGAFRPRAEVVVERPARRYNELGLLLPLGWYLMTLSRRDQAAAAAGG